jgi:phosphohistidine phosphatase
MADPPVRAVQQLFLLHHGEALPEHVDSQRPLSARGKAMVVRLAEQAAGRGVHPAAIWHSGKLRARDTAEAFWKACNPLAEFRAVRGLQPTDGPWWLRDHLLGEVRDVMIVGHMPHLPRVLGSLTTGDDDARIEFPLHGLVVLERTEGSTLWRESWRLSVDE